MRGMCQFLIGKVQRGEKEVKSGEIIKLCQFLIGKVQQVEKDKDVEKKESFNSS